MIETREDGSQTIKSLKWKIPYNVGRVADNDDSLMAELKPYFDQGWALVSSNSVNNTESNTFVIHYFLRKEQ